MAQTVMTAPRAAVAQRESPVAASPCRLLFQVAGIGALFTSTEAT